MSTYNNQTKMVFVETITGAQGGVERKDHNHNEVKVKIPDPKMISKKHQSERDMKGGFSEANYEYEMGPSEDDLDYLDCEPDSDTKWNNDESSKDTKFQNQYSETDKSAASIAWNAKAVAKYEINQGRGLQNMFKSVQLQSASSNSEHDDTNGYQADMDSETDSEGNTDTDENDDSERTDVDSISTSESPIYFSILRSRCKKHKDCSSCSASESFSNDSQKDIETEVDTEEDSKVC